MRVRDSGPAEELKKAKEREIEKMKLLNNLEEKKGFSIEVLNNAVLERDDLFSKRNDLAEIMKQLVVERERLVNARENQGEDPEILKLKRQVSLIENEKKDLYQILETKKTNLEGALNSFTIQREKTTAVEEISAKFKRDYLEIQKLLPDLRNRKKVLISVSEEQNVKLGELVAIVENMRSGN